ncbi:hypothetical protein ACIA8K_30825 [Catenuloplanes sp. NPDC051500]|uniref:hypothetical protein n=1 Tax=Catenuloplanes sp. NPDC051500 TaxID=3363959 RepID=UPI0037B82EC5
MSWTEADGDALFRQPPGDKADDEKQGAFDGGPEAMRRLRNPFETDRQADEKPSDDDTSR